MTDQPQQKTSGVAIWGFVCGILAILTCGITALPAFILCIIGLVITKGAGNPRKGQGLSIAGLVLAFVSLVIAVLIGLPVSNQVKEQIANVRAKKTCVEIRTALMNYFTEYKRFSFEGGKADAKGDLLFDTSNQAFVDSLASGE